MRWLITQFANDRETYPDEDVHRRGHRCGDIPKIILEEYEPLAALANHLRRVRCARLTRAGTKGRDAEVWLRPRRRIGVEIRCADQSYDAALQREKLASGKPASRRYAPDADVAVRIERIRKAIEKKCANYDGNAEILLIEDESANLEHLNRNGFIARVREIFRTLGSVPYGSVYVCFYNTVVSLRAGSDCSGQLV